MLRYLFQQEVTDYGIGIVAWAKQTGWEPQSEDLFDIAIVFGVDMEDL